MCIQFKDSFKKNIRFGHFNRKKADYFYRFSVEKYTSKMIQCNMYK